MSEIDRSTYVGGSDAAALVGQNKYKTVRDVWDKLRGKTDTDLSGNPHIERGNDLEPVVERWIKENLDPTINDEARFERFDAGDESDQIFLRHPNADFIGGHPDGMGRGDPTEEGSVIYEIKVPSSTAMDKIKRHGIPSRYYWQVQHYMMIANTDTHPVETAYMVIWDCDDWGNPLFLTINNSPENAQELEERSRNVYFAAQKGLLPDFEDIPDSEIETRSDEDIESLLADYYEVKEELSEAKGEKERLKSKILTALKGREFWQGEEYSADIKYDWGRYDATRLKVDRR